MTPILQVEHLEHVYSPHTPFEMTALHDVNLEIRRGEFIALVGHTGSGKSTLIQHLNGLIKPTAGRVCFNGTDIHQSKELLRSVRFHVGLVFQYPEYQLFEDTVYKDIAFGPKNSKLSEQEIDERVREAADFVGLQEAALTKSPFDMSGGQKRRVAIAGVIAMRPEVLILDEPSAGLDPAGCESIIANICRYHEETGAAIVMVTHNMEEAARYAKRILVLKQGGIAMDGTPNAVFSRSEELEQIGLTVPTVNRVVRELRAKGVPIDSGICTREQAVAALAALRKRGWHHA